MTTLICCNCQVEYRVRENGVLLVSMDANNAAHSARWGDTLECKQCGHVACVVPDGPLAAIGCKATKELVDRVELRSETEVHRYWLRPAEKIKALEHQPKETR